jgi:hypothetical protein
MQNASTPQLIMTLYLDAYQVIIDAINVTADADTRVRGDDAGLILAYLLVQAAPKLMHSVIQFEASLSSSYADCFSGPDKSRTETEFTLRSMKSVVDYLSKLNPACKEYLSLEHIGRISIATKQQQTPTQFIELPLLPLNKTTN